MFISVLGQNTKRESGRKVQSGNINAAKVAHIFSVCMNLFWICDISFLWICLQRIQLSKGKIAFPRHFFGGGMGREVL